jgi:hypothetical protein
VLYRDSSFRSFGETINVADIQRVGKWGEAIKQQLRGFATRLASDQNLRSLVPAFVRDFNAWEMMFNMALATAMTMDRYDFQKRLDLIIASVKALSDNYTAQAVSLSKTAPTLVIEESTVIEARPRTSTSTSSTPPPPPQTGTDTPCGAGYQRSTTTGNCVKVERFDQESLVGRVPSKLPWFVGGFGALAIIAIAFGGRR